MSSRAWSDDYVSADGSDLSAESLLEAFQSKSGLGDLSDDETDIVLSAIPGITTMVGQPIEHRLSHLLSGTPAAAILALFGTQTMSPEMAVMPSIYFVFSSSSVSSPSLAAIPSATA